MNILFFLFAIVGLILLMILFAVMGFIRNILSVIFNFGKKNRQATSSDGTKQEHFSKKKVFDNAEGEYVDYEEVK